MTQKLPPAEGKRLQPNQSSELLSSDEINYEKDDWRNDIYFPVSNEILLADMHNEDNIATPKDITQRMDEQDAHFLELQTARQLTPEWKKYGMRREANGKLIIRGGKES